MPDSAADPRFPITDIAWPADHGEADVCLWPDDKVAAVTFSIDDNDAPEIDWWVQQMDQRGWKMTWFVITHHVNSNMQPEFGYWTDFRRLDSLGHDIESHTVNHLFDQALDTASDSVVDAEYRLSRKAIEDSIPGHKCRTLAYPGCQGRPSLAAKYYLSARSCSGHADKANQVSYMDVLTGDFFAPWNTIGWIQEITHPTPGYEGYYRGWFNKFFHRYDTNTLSELDLVESQETSLWVGTYTDAAMYSQEYATHTLNVTKVTNSLIQFSLSDSMADSIYTYPLTVKVRVNNNWGDSIDAVQDGKAIPVRLVMNGGLYYVLVKAVPDRGEVALAKKGTTNLALVPVNPGWNMLSLNVHPQDSSAGGLFGPLHGFVLSKNNLGQIYWPADGINTIGHLATGQGYSVYADSTDTLRVSGSRIDVVSTPVFLAAGWNMIGYLPENDMPVATALSAIVAQTTIVKNSRGEIYWPEYSISTIGNMKVGQGYKIHMKSVATLIYPASGKSLVSAHEWLAPPRAVHYLPNLNTGNTASVLSTLVIDNGAIAPDNSEIGAFDEKGVLVGAGVVIRGITVFPVWGDDARTLKKDGCTAAEKITFRFWDSARETPAEFEDSVTVSYQEDGLFIGKLTAPVALSIAKFALKDAYPNPFNPSTTIRACGMTVGNPVLFRIFDIQGRLVVCRSIVPVSGNLVFEWNAKGMPSGIYILEAKTGGKSFMKRLVLAK